MARLGGSYKLSKDGRTKMYQDGTSETDREFGSPTVFEQRSSRKRAEQQDADAAMEQYMASRTARRGQAIQNQAMSDQLAQQSKENRFKNNALVDQDQQRDVEFRRRAVMDPAIDNYLRGQVGPAGENMTRGQREDTINGQPAYGSGLPDPIQVPTSPYSPPLPQTQPQPSAASNPSSWTPSTATTMYDLNLYNVPQSPSRGAAPSPQGAAPAPPARPYGPQAAAGAPASSTRAQGTMRPPDEGTINGEPVSPYSPAVVDAAENWMDTAYGGSMSIAEKQALINQQTAEARNASQFEIAKMRNDSQMNRERYKSEYDSTLQSLRMQSQNDQQAKQLLAGFHKQALDLLDNEERRLAEEYATISYLRPDDPKIIDLRQRQASVKQSKQDRMDSYLQSVMQPPPQYNVGPPQGAQASPDPTMGATGYAGPPQGDQSQAQAPQSDMPDSFVAAVERASAGKGNPTPDIEEIKAAWQQLDNTQRARFLGGAVK